MSMHTVIDMQPPARPAIYCAYAQVHEVARLEHSSPVWQVEWNLFGNWLATSTHDAQVLIANPTAL